MGLPRQPEKDRDPDPLPYKVVDLTKAPVFRAGDLEVSFRPPKQVVRGEDIAVSAALVVRNTSATLRHDVEAVRCGRRDAIRVGVATPVGGGRC
jgi:hypothetical protein